MTSDKTAASRNLRPRMVLRKGAKEARSQLPALLDAAEQGRSTIITRHGRPVAALVPMSAYEPAARQQPLLPLKGSGCGLWGKDSTRTIGRKAWSTRKYSLPADPHQRSHRAHRSLEPCTAPHPVAKPLRPNALWI